MSDKTLATFKIEPNKWEAFKQKAIDAGSNASATLKDFIDAFIDGRIEIKSDGTINTESGLDGRIEAVLERLIPRYVPNIDGVSQKIEQLTEAVREQDDRLGKSKSKPKGFG
jgi:hypothetical protein